MSKMDDGTGLCADISARDEAREFLSSPTNKSVAVDHETWGLLTEWAEEECRTVGGQIRWLVRKHRGQKKLSLASVVRIDSPQDTVTQHPAEWVQKKCKAKFMVLGDSQRGLVIDLLNEYEDPITNTELHALFPETLPVEAIQKQTAGMYTRGLLKRRDSHTDINNDKYQYQLTVAAHRLLKRRDQKRENT